MRCRTRFSRVGNFCYSGVGMNTLPLRGEHITLAQALKVLGQQFLIMLVGQSDRFLAGNFEPVGPQQQAEALGHHLIALGLVAGNLPAQGTAGVLAAEASWEAVRQLTASQVAYQAAQ